MDYHIQALEEAMKHERVESEKMNNINQKLRQELQAVSQELNAAKQEISLLKSAGFICDGYFYSDFVCDMIILIAILRL
jgi:hypothetical protein